MQFDLFAAFVLIFTIDSLVPGRAVAIASIWAVVLFGYAKSASHARERFGGRSAARCLNRTCAGAMAATAATVALRD